MKRRKIYLRWDTKQTERCFEEIDLIRHSFSLKKRSLEWLFASYKLFSSLISVGDCLDATISNLQFLLYFFFLCLILNLSIEGQIGMQQMMKEKYAPSIVLSITWKNLQSFSLKSSKISNSVPSIVLLFHFLFCFYLLMLKEKVVLQYMMEKILPPFYCFIQFFWCLFFFNFSICLFYSRLRR